MHLRWVRYAAAAAVVLIAGLLWLNKPEQDATLTGPASLARADSGSPETPEQNQETAPSANISAQINSNEGLTEQATQSPGVAEKQLASVSSPKKSVQQAQTARAGSGQQREQSTPREAVSQQLVVTEPAPRETMEVAAQVTMPDNPNTGALVKETANRPAVMEGVKTDYAAQALATQQQGGNRENMYREQDKERKGFRGLVRKANRIFNKVTNPDLDGTVVKVANVQIGLGR